MVLHGCGIWAKLSSRTSVNNQMEEKKDLEQIVKDRIQLVTDMIPGSIGDLMKFHLISCDPDRGEYTLGCSTGEWMRNVAGTLHGGMCATIVDQAMGFIAHCVKPGEGVAPTVQMQVCYHRPLIPGKDVIVRVKVLSVTKSLMHLTGEAVLAEEPDRICLTSTGMYFYKPARQ